MVFEYLLMGVCAHVEGMTTAHGGCLFVNRPWAHDNLYATSWLSGGAVEVTRTGRPMPEGPHVHGEGDMLCRVWSDFFAKTDPAAKIVIRSKDLDMLGIYAASPPRGDCRLHITTTKDRKFEFIHVPNLHQKVLRTRERALSFVYSLILAGSDYCEGVHGVSGLNLVKAALAAPDGDQVVCCVERRHRVDKKRLERWITRSAPRSRAAVALSRHRLMFCRANWNLDYWMSNVRVPDPIAYGGWSRQKQGFMPLLA